ncbi:hypothetical protein [Rhodocyclus tenuis]|uniref:Uncharacterized protein n=1 Tax=Rhodocyclus tenuis TaxID=1066 RepID=A0A840GA37_RHOTE|nr:hypothetical protein [Rhodocyclus tenuis]MBB4248735.1 hypothetical protein [Rhodocyclus tenuis]
MTTPSVAASGNTIATPPGNATAQWASLTARVAEVCERMPVAGGVGALARELSHTPLPGSPELSYREVLSRGGWYRLGGVVDGSDASISRDLEHWAEAALAECDGDLHTLADRHVDDALFATRFNGMTHYLVAATGNGAADFIQVEIEELQEVVSHPLFADETVPGSLEELLDPPGLRRSSAKPLGAPFYTLRRVTDIAAFLARMRAQKPDAQPVHRFIAAWEASSAGQAAQFSNHWALAIREHLDRYRQPILQATPLVAINGEPPHFQGAFGAQGLALQAALNRFDRQAGYPMAWFFHMLTSKTLPHAVAFAVIDDVQSGFSYLPERDVKVLRDWIHRPYGF